MGIKISELPNATVPLSGGEVLPLVQDGETRNAAISSITTLLSGSFNGIDTGVRALTSNWQGTYTTVLANSAQWGTDTTGISGINTSASDI